MATERNVSCIVPTHNRDHLLNDAIQSVVAQSVTPRELIVVDDLRRRDTRTIVQSWADLARFPVRYVEGVVVNGNASRNLGAHLAEGEQLAFLDDDDWWEPSYLEMAQRAMEVGRCDFVVVAMLAHRNGLVTELESIPMGVLASESVSRHWGFGGSNIAISRRVFMDVGGFDESLEIYQDRDLFIRLLKCGYSYCAVDERLAHYRDHDGSRVFADKDRHSRELRRYRGREALYRKHRDVMSLSARLKFRMIIEQGVLRTDANLARKFVSLLVCFPLVGVKVLSRLHLRKP